MKVKIQLIAAMWLLFSFASLEANDLSAEVSIAKSGHYPACNLNLAGKTLTAENYHAKGPFAEAPAFELGNDDCYDLWAGFMLFELNENDETVLSVFLYNSGQNGPITSFALNWSVDGVEQQTIHATNQNLLPDLDGELFEVGVISVSDVFEIELSVENPNGSLDCFPEDNFLTETFENPDICAANFITVEDLEWIQDLQVCPCDVYSYFLCDVIYPDGDSNQQSEGYIYLEAHGENDCGLEGLYNMVGDLLCSPAEDCSDEFLQSILDDFPGYSFDACAANCTGISVTNHFPTDTISFGETDFSLTITNEGPAILNSAEIVWRIESMPQVSFVFTDLNLAVGESIDVVYGSFNFETAGTFEIGINVTEINGGFDCAQWSAYYLTVEGDCYSTVCDDGDPCTEDVCENGDCFFIDIEDCEPCDFVSCPDDDVCHVYECVDGVCINIFSEDCQPCEFSQFGCEANVILEGGACSESPLDSYFPVASSYELCSDENLSLSVESNLQEGEDTFEFVWTDASYNTIADPLNLNPINNSCEPIIVEYHLVQLCTIDESVVQIETIEITIHPTLLMNLADPTGEPEYYTAEGIFCEEFVDDMEEGCNQETTNCISKEEASNLVWLHGILCANSGSEAFVICTEEIEQEFTSYILVNFNTPDDNVSTVYNISGNIICSTCNACDGCDTFGLDLSEMESGIYCDQDLCETFGFDLELSNMFFELNDNDEVVLSIFLYNIGISGPITSFSVNWSVDGVAQQTVEATDQALFIENHGTLFEVGVFPVSQNFEIAVSVENPNGSFDCDPQDNSLTLTFVNPDICAVNYLTAEDLDWIQDLQVCSCDITANFLCDVIDPNGGGNPNAEGYIWLEANSDDECGLEGLYNIEGDLLCSPTNACSDAFLQNILDDFPGTYFDPCSATCTHVSTTNLLPAENIESGVNDFFLTITNYGPGILDSGEIVWVINNQFQEPYAFVDLNLAVGESYELNYGSFYFETLGEYEIFSEVIEINGEPDCSQETIPYNLIVDAISDEVSCYDGDPCTEDVYENGNCLFIEIENCEPCDFVSCPDDDECHLYECINGNCINLYTDLCGDDEPDDGEGENGNNGENEDDCANVSASNYTAVSSNYAICSGDYFNLSIEDLEGDEDDFIFVWTNASNFPIDPDSLSRINWSCDATIIDFYLVQLCPIDDSVLQTDTVSITVYPELTANLAAPEAQAEYYTETGLFCGYDLDPNNTCIEETENCLSQEEAHKLAWLNEILCANEGSEAYLVCFENENQELTSAVVVDYFPDDYFLTAFDIEGNHICETCDGCDQDCIAQEDFETSIGFSCSIIEPEENCTDASILDMLTATNFEPGVETFTIRLLNNGPEDLQSVTVNWSIDGAEQLPYELIDFNLLVGNYYDLNIGSYNFEAGEYNLAIELVSPNGTVDCNAGNNTFFSSLIVEESNSCSDFLMDYSVNCDGTDAFYMVTVVGINPDDLEYWLITDNSTGEQTTEASSPFMVGPFFNQAGFSITVEPVGGLNSDCAFDFTESMVDCVSTEIDIVAFDAVISGPDNFVFWTSATEYESSAFVLEHSFDGMHFSPLQEIPSKGFSNTEVRYEYTHKDVLARNNYYRLVELDINGNKEVITEVVSVDNSISNSLLEDQSPFRIEIFPNPSHSNFNIQIENQSDAHLQILDIKGRLMHEEILTGAATVNSENWPQGLYVVRVLIGQNSAVKRFLKLK